MMPRPRPSRVEALTGIGVDKMGDLADHVKRADLLRMENLDVNIFPDPIVAQITSESATRDDDNSYLPFIGQTGLRTSAAAHVSAMTNNQVTYTADNCVISAGGLSGILNTLLATVEIGDGVILFDPCYSGLINRVKLVGGVPVFVPLEFYPGGFWKLNKQIFEERIGDAKVMLLMSPSLPSGFWLDEDEWRFVADICIKRDMLLILDTAMERLLFDGMQVFHPAAIPGMEERTITVGSASKELRMIGWRVGWVVGPQKIISDIGLVGMANVVVPVGIAQRAAQEALDRSAAGVAQFAEELQKRRDMCMKELEAFPVGVPAGGWSFLLEVGSLGWTGAQASQALLQHGVCTTAMDGWGEKHGPQYVRFVFSNESRDRLEGLGEKVRAALQYEESSK
jgi:N-succinyldiaminopimelate aminotransferase